MRGRLNPILAAINGLFTLTLVAFVAFGVLLYYAKQQFDQQGPLKHTSILVIPKGEGVTDIADRLERNGIITDRRIFKAAVIYFRAGSKLKAGEYQIHKGSSMRQVLDTLVEGRAILHKVSIPEGWTSERVVERLRADPMLTGEIAAIPPEGSLLPDTYKYGRGTTRKELIEQMQAAQTRLLNKLWEGRVADLPLATPEDAVILASIVEKETGRADERREVAAVFINRLRKRMRLESDPTVIYGIAGGRGRLDRPIYRSDLDKETPYNTYKISGLPPTPIANPGRAALEAVMQPATTKALFFVADGTGGHAFSETLNEHNRNVAAWRRIERARRAAERAAAAEKAAAETRSAVLSTEDDVLGGGASETLGATGVPVPGRRSRPSR